jgi:hypothetical protein
LVNKGARWTREWWVGVRSQADFPDMYLGTSTRNGEIAGNSFNAAAEALAFQFICLGPPHPISR